MGVLIILISQHVNVLYSTYMSWIFSSGCPNNINVSTFQCAIFYILPICHGFSPVGVLIILISQHVSVLYSTCMS